MLEGRSSITKSSTIFTTAAVVLILFGKFRKYVRGIFHVCDQSPPQIGQKWGLVLYCILCLMPFHSGASLHNSFGKDMLVPGSRTLAPQHMETLPWSPLLLVFWSHSFTCGHSQNATEVRLWNPESYLML